MTSDDEEIDSTDHEKEENSLKGVNLGKYLLHYRAKS